jgi:hypothetical protein
MCLVAYGIIAGFFVPRFLAGSMQIIPIGSTDYASTGSTVPLGPTSGNFTQAMYLIADLVCFVLIAAVASSEAGFRAVAGAVVAYAAANVVFAFIDIATYSSGTQWVLDFIRNAQYALHVEEEASGMKRIVGSFTETVAFAHAALGVFAFTGTLFLFGRWKMLTGPLALVSLLLAVFSTSSTGLASAPAVLVILYITALMRRGFSLARPVSSGVLLCAPLLVIAAVLALQLDEQAARPLHNYIDDLILNKPVSDSGVERAMWNRVGWQNFLDSYGLGIGLGTARTSSLLTALLSNLGIPGLIFYLLFLLSALGGSRGIQGTFYADVRLAARNACLTFILTDLIAGATVDQGLLFYALAALAYAKPERSAEWSVTKPIPQIRARL